MKLKLNVNYVEVNYRYARIMVELVCVCNNILQVISLSNDLGEDLKYSKYLKVNKCHEKRRKKEHYKEHLLKYKEMHKHQRHDKS